MKVVLAVAFLMPGFTGTTLAAPLPDDGQDMSVGPTSTSSLSAPSGPTMDWPLWEGFKTRFLDSGEGRVIDREAGDRTTSEGQAYGLFFALVANDRPNFDRILRWTGNNLAAGDLRRRLPAWSWGKTEDGWRVLDENSASDADLWIAYTLIEAGRLWREPALSELGRDLARLMERREVIEMDSNGQGARRSMLLPGANGFVVQPGDATSGEVRFFANPSYLAPQLLARLSGELPTGPWTQILAEVPSVWSQGQIEGLTSDWTIFAANRYRSGAPEGIIAAASYDAIRVYLWAGMLDGKFPRRNQLLEPLNGMIRYLRDHDFPPERIPLQGEWSLQGSVGFSAAVAPLLDALGEQELLARQQQRVLAALDGGDRSGSPNVSPYGLPYYDHALMLFSQGWSEGRYRFGMAGELTVDWKSATE